MADSGGSADNVPRTFPGAGSEPADSDASRSASGTDAADNVPRTFPGAGSEPADSDASSSALGAEALEVGSKSSPGSSPEFRSVAAAATIGVGYVRTAGPGGKS